MEMLRSMGELAACIGQPRLGARLYAAAAAIRERTASPVIPALRPEYDRTEQMLCAALGDEAFAREWEAGFAITSDEALALAQQVVRISS